MLEGSKDPLKDALGTGDLEAVKRAADSLQRAGGDAIRELSAIALAGPQTGEGRLAFEALQGLDAAAAKAVTARTQAPRRPLEARNASPWRVIQWGAVAILASVSMFLLLDGRSAERAARAAEEPADPVPTASAPSTEPTPSSASSAEPKPSSSMYSVINEEALGHKRNLDVRLKRKVSRAELKEIALTLVSGKGKFERTFIVYYLPGMKPGEGGWATTHFDPDIEIRILGLSAKEENSLRIERAAGAASNVYGVWLDERPYVGSRITIYRENGAYRLERKFKDGSVMKEDLVMAGTSRFNIPGNSFGEYYIVDSQGRLESRDPSGLASRSKRIK